MEETYLTKAIILKRQLFKENDHRIIAYTLEKGKISLLARGTTKINSKLAGHIEPISLVDIMVVRGKKYDYAGSVINQSQFLNLKNDFDKIQIAGNIIREINKRTEENETDPELFYLLFNFLNILNNETVIEDYDLFYSIFLFKLLILLGHTPELNYCVNCKKEINSDFSFFNFFKGGLICCQCQGKNNNSLTISKNSVKILKIFISEKSINSLIKIEIDKKLKEELVKNINTFYKYIHY